ncbi:amino acid ABC transporter permease [Microbacterium marinilacus]|uniref:Amino acid ABC transporter permease n=1 Tax=Microbacterium marinilacus TaxID=415209 RepID=A0ABP7B586_9MICO|nr:amino acid ABC transporter permease [Microbacterium marinilacus]MBY0689972.1 amino acid ABC transporter permease [Microbacterium marinilacus]
MGALEHLPVLGRGLVVSLELTAISVVFGYALGLLLALGVASRRPWLKWPTLVVVEIGRGISALVVLYIVYFGLPSLDIVFDSFWSAAVGLTFTAGAYSSEMIRAGIQSVPRGQTEAASALGLTGMTSFLRIVLPQGLRSAIPALMGLAIMSFQATSLAYSISVGELMGESYRAAAVTFEYLQVYAITGLIYAVISVPATWLSVMVERRLARGHA